MAEDIGIQSLRLAQNGYGQIFKIQRARMLAAMVDEIAERGVGNVSVAHVVARSGVSRRTFYEVFRDREDCFLAAFDDAMERVTAFVVPVYEEGGPWRSKLRAALTALLRFLEDERGTGRLVIVETLGAGPAALERRHAVLAEIIAVIDQGRAESKAGTEPSPITAEGVIGGVLSVLHARLLEDQPGSLTSLVNELMSMIVLPYLGRAAARKELERPVPKVTVGPRKPVRDPLRELEMRLTYRTIRVLTAVAAHPRSSNRQVADASGVADQGQMSKLLGRLDNLGLIENTGTGPSPGEPNAWVLTPAGDDVQGVLTGQSTRS